MSEPSHDIFICHASEDKSEVAQPLAAALRDRGHHVWYDEFELKMGDNLRERIDAGLAKSRYGVVILSPNFFSKPWAQYELGGLTALEMTNSGRKRILPVLHHVTVEDLVDYSPGLAGKLAADTKDGLEQVVAMIEGVLGAPETESQVLQTKPQNEATNVELQAAEEWATRVDIPGWPVWTEGLFMSYSTIAAGQDDRLNDLNIWLAGRYWPDPDAPIPAAIRNFAAVLTDFRDVFHRECEYVGSHVLRVRPFYRLDGPGPHVQRLVPVFERHQRLIWNLVAELSRAGNLILDRVRQIDPTFHALDGVLVTLAGTDPNPTVIFRYTDEEAALPQPYPGLDDFPDALKNRSGVFGAGHEQVAAYDPTREY